MDTKSRSDSTTIIPFGKYKGQPIEILSQDQGYFDWLLSQDWFKNKFPNLYTIVINNFSAPSETPEHNLAQAKFLEHDYSIRIARLVWDETVFVDTVEMEVDGLDVLIEGICERKERNGAYNIHGKWIYKEEEIIVQRWIRTFVEVKPTLGDDYPAVLRQIKTSIAFQKRKSGALTRFCLLVGDYSGIISHEELKTIFKSSGIMVLFEQDIDSTG